MTNISNIPADLSNSFESLPHSVDEYLPPALIADSSPILIITAGYDHTIRFWDVLQGACIATLQHNESVIRNKKKRKEIIFLLCFVCSKLIQSPFHRIKSS